MRRKAVAAVWIIGTTLPLFLAAVFLVGCCVLPFHGVIHKIMPLCEMAASMIRGDRAEHEHETMPPARDNREPIKRVVTEIPNTFRLAALTAAERIIHASPATAYRSFITLGATRCDQDVGLNVVVQLFRI